MQVGIQCDNVVIFNAWSVEGSSKTEITRIKRTYEKDRDGFITYACDFKSIVVDHTLDELIADDGTIT